jgi:phosphoribosyl 1,2-cyclic phosphodiesterase
VHQHREFVTGESFTVGTLKIRSFRVFHDTADPVGFVIDDGRHAIGYCTDTGKTSHLMARRLASCSALILEFNHNPEMLKNGPYPLPLQQRVRSSLGHLSNDQAASFLTEISSQKLRHLVLAHLSEQNNTPELALAAAKASLPEAQGQELHLAGQYTPLPPIDLAR